MQEIHYTPGRFVWHELMTSDVEASRRFYGELVGWSFEDATQKVGHPYTYLTKNGHVVGGMRLRPGPHIPPHVLGYVSVLDVDDVIQIACAYGGAVMTGPTQLPVGQLAVVQDPFGSMVGVWKSASGDPPEVIAPGVGTFCWDQLNTSDADSAADFYGRLFGWQRELFAGADGLSIFMRGARQAGSVMQAPQGTYAHWLTYIAVASLDRSRELAKQLGGQVMVPQVMVPHVGRFAVIQDNLGAIVALFEPQRR